MWVTKLMIFQVKKRIFCPKTTKFGPKMAFLVNLGQALLAHLVGGCGARAVSRKTPIYFIFLVGALDVFSIGMVFLLNFVFVTCMYLVFSPPKNS